MIKKWAESAKFEPNQKLVEQIRLFLKKGWLSELELLEIWGQVNREEYTQKELSK